MKPALTKLISIKFKPDTYGALKQWATDEGMGDNMSAFLRSRLLKYLREKGEDISKLQRTN